MTQEEQAKGLDKLTKTKLVEEAHKYPAIVGASGMEKEELIEAIREERKKLGEDVPEAPVKAKKTVKKSKKKQPDRVALKTALKELKIKRREALEAKDSLQLSRVRQSYKRINRILRRTAPSA
jgi:hypothetical protein